MQITIPLSHFADYLNEVKHKRQTWLDETEWLIVNFRFDTDTATYQLPDSAT